MINILTVKKLIEELSKFDGDGDAVPINFIGGGAICPDGHKDPALYISLFDDIQ